MKTKNFKTSVILLAVLTLISCSNLSSAIQTDPTNAALIYYQALLMFNEPNDAMRKTLDDFRDGKIAFNDQIAAYLKSNSECLRLINKGSELAICDWGLIYSDGLNMMMTPLARMKDIGSRLLAVEARRLALAGNYSEALSQCLALKRFVSHVYQTTLISYLVSISIDTIANQDIIYVLSLMAPDAKEYQKLKVELGLINKNPSFKTLIDAEAKVFGNAYFEQLQKEPKSLENFLKEASVPQETVNIILNTEPEFMEKSHEYYNNYYLKIQSLPDQPYAVVLKDINNIQEATDAERCQNKYAMMTSILAPSLMKIYTYTIKTQTELNALEAALDVYIIKAETGKLPETLPVNLPKDLFSGKDFLYEKTADGFVLKCQGKDLMKDKLYEYNFKGKK